LHQGQATFNSAFLVSERMKGAEAIGNCLPSIYRTVCHSEVCTSGLKCLKAAKPVLMQTGKDTHSQAMILGNCRLTIVEIAVGWGLMLLILGENL
jgi:hypothetical protein